MHSDQHQTNHRTKDKGTSSVKSVNISCVGKPSSPDTRPLTWTRPLLPLLMPCGLIRSARLVPRSEARAPRIADSRPNLIGRGWRLDKAKRGKQKQTNRGNMLLQPTWTHLTYWMVHWFGTDIGLVPILVWASPDRRMQLCWVKAQSPTKPPAQPSSQKCHGPGEAGGPEELRDQGQLPLSFLE